MAQYDTESGLTVVTKNQRALARAPQKSLTFEQLITRLQGSSYYGMGTSQQDIAYSKIGAAACYTLVSEVNNCISSIVSGLQLLPWDIKRYPDGVRRQDGRMVEGQVLASNDDLQNRHPFQQMLRQFHRANGFGLLGVMALDYSLYGEVVLEVATNMFGYNPRIEWLNPLGVFVYAQSEIEMFRYGWNTTYVSYDPDDIRYLHNRNPNDDFTGLPRVLTALDKINILRNLDRFLRDYFVNNARPGLIVQPPNPDMNWSDKDYKKIKELVSSDIGAGSQFATWVMQRAVQATPLDQPDLAKNEQISEREANGVYEVFSVPRAMRGNTSATPYKDGDETTRRFYLDAVIPLAILLQDFINFELMPYYDRTHGLEVFEFDTSQFDLVTAADQLEEQIVTSQLQAGYITITEAQRVQERPVDPAMDGRYLVNGLPMRIEHIDRLIEATIAQAEAASLIQPQQLFAMPTTPENAANPPTPTEPDNMVRRLDAPKKAVLDDGEEDGVDKALCDNDGQTVASWQSALYKGDPDEPDIDERIIKELRQWRSFALRAKSDRPFKPNVLPPWIHHAVIDALDACKSNNDIDAAFGIIWDTPRIKSVTSYQRGFRELGTGFWRGDIGKRDFSNRSTEHIRRGLQEAFLAGVERGGLSREDLEDDEFNDLLDAIAEEQQHVTPLAEYIDANSRDKGGRLGLIRARVDRWVVRYENLEELGYIIASKTQRLKWIWDPRVEEHCIDCARLNGRVYLGRTWRKWEITPRSTKLNCFLGCRCKTEKTDDPVTRGRPPRLVGPR